LLTTCRYLRGADPNQLAAEYHRTRESVQGDMRLRVSTSRNPSS
jgi:hypothetical protein